MIFIQNKDRPTDKGTEEKYPNTVTSIKKDAFTHRQTDRRIHTYTKKGVFCR